MTQTIDYLADAPSYTAWAGTSECAERIYAAAQAGRPDALVAFRAAVNTAVAALVDAGEPIADALAAYDPDQIIGDLSPVLTWTGDCHECGAVVAWTTAYWEPRETEAPFDHAGRVVCDECHECV